MYNNNNNNDRQRTNFDQKSSVKLKSFILKNFKNLCHLPQYTSSRYNLLDHLTHFWIKAIRAEISTTNDTCGYSSIYLLNMQIILIIFRHIMIGLKCINIYHTSFKIS